MHGEGASTRIGSFLSPLPPGRVPRERKEKEKKEKKKITRGRELREEREARCGGSRTCVRLRETGNGYGPEWTDGRGDGRSGVKAAEDGEQEERVRRGEGRQGFGPLRRNHRA